MLACGEGCNVDNLDNLDNLYQSFTHTSSESKKGG